MIILYSPADAALFKEVVADLGGKEGISLLRTARGKDDVRLECYDDLPQGMRIVLDDERKFVSLEGGVKL